MENAAPSLFPSFVDPAPDPPPAPAVEPVADPTPVAPLAPQHPGLHRGFSAPENGRAPSWSLEHLTGRLCEIAGVRAPRLTLATALVLEAQRSGQPVAWIHPPDSCFHPPDLAASGVDLDALPVIHAPDALAGARAADHLLRSGAFGLVVFDLPVGEGLPLAAQTRLAGLVRRHRAVLLCLSRGERPRRDALGSLVSWRAEGSTVRTAPGHFRAAMRVTKDKRRGPGAEIEVMRRGPDGLC